MAISDILKTYSIHGTTTTEDGRMLALSLAAIEAELKKLASLINFPEIRIPDLDTTGIEEAIKELKSGFPGPVAPQTNLDLNPIIETYKQTQATIKELMGEVKSTNARIGGISRGGGGPSVVGLHDSNGNRVVVNPDGTLAGTPHLVGTPFYRAGSGDATVTLTDTQYLLGISVWADGANGTFSVNSGDPITVRASSGRDWNTLGNYVGPTITFTGPLDWLVEGVT